MLSSPPCGVTNPRQVFNLAVVRALPDDEHEQFSSFLTVSGYQALDDELVTQDTS
jgi:hypothetical protein